MSDRQERSEGLKSLDRLVVAAQAGDTEALGKLLGHVREVLNRCRPQQQDPLRGLYSDSDYYQDTCLTVQKEFASFRGTTFEEFGCWVVQIHKHGLANTRRFYSQMKRSVQRVVRLDDHLAHGGEEPVSREPLPEEEAIGHEQAQLLEEALERLPKPLGQVLLWRVTEGLTHAEVGERLHCSTEAARHHWRRLLYHLHLDPAPPASGHDPVAAQC